MKVLFISCGDPNTGCIPAKAEVLAYQEFIQDQLGSQIKVVALPYTVQVSQVMDLDISQCKKKQS